MSVVRQRRRRRANSTASARCVGGVAVQDVRGGAVLPARSPGRTPPRSSRSGSASGSARPSRLISAALDHGPRLPASVSAVSRTKRAIRGSKVTVCAVFTSRTSRCAAAAPRSCRRCWSRSGTGRWCRSCSRARPGQVAQAGDQVALVPCRWSTDAAAAGRRGAPRRVPDRRGVAVDARSPRRRSRRPVSWLSVATRPAGARQRRIGAAEQVDLRGGRPGVPVAGLGDRGEPDDTG